MFERRCSLHDRYVFQPEILKKLDAKAVPKAVAQAREELTTVGAEITGDNLKTVLTKATLNNLSNAFRTSMSAANKEAYKVLSGDSERRNWLAQYVLEPKEFRGKA